MRSRGGRFGGYGLYLLKGKPVFLYNLLDLERFRWEGPEALSPGKHTVEFDFKYEGIGAGTLAFTVAAIGWFVQLVREARRPRLLWYVRRKLTASYIFLGFVPIALILAFFAVSN